MTLGEKIRWGRRRCGLSQEQLADKMCVSRSAVAKWETDKGLPDIYNLKALAAILDMSLDALLNEQCPIGQEIRRERISLAQWGRGCKKVKKDRLIREKYPQARIWTLLGQPELTKAEKIMDNAVGILTTAPFGIPEMINSIKNLDKAFYLVEQDGKQYFVTVTDELLEARLMAQPLTEKQFRLGDWSFIKSNYEVN